MQGTKFSHTTRPDGASKAAVARAACDDTISVESRHGGWPLPSRLAHDERQCLAAVQVPRYHGLLSAGRLDKQHCTGRLLHPREPRRDWSDGAMARKRTKYVSGGKAYQESIDNPPRPTGQYPPDEPATTKQRRFLLGHGMTESEVNQLTKRQASHEIDIYKLVDHGLSHQEAALRVPPVARETHQAPSADKHADDGAYLASADVSDRAVQILSMIAQGFTYDQILDRIDALTPRDIFDAAQEVLNAMGSSSSGDADTGSAEDPDEVIPF